MGFVKSLALLKEQDFTTRIIQGLRVGKPLITLKTLKTLNNLVLEIFEVLALLKRGGSRFVITVRVVFAALAGALNLLVFE